MSRFPLFLAVFLFAASLFSSAAAYADSNVLFIVDYSGSMKKLVEGKESRIAIAKRVVGETLDSMPAGSRLGLMAYGHRKAKDCTDIELIAPMGGEDAASIGKTVKSLSPKGETPIAEALRKAGKSFNAFKGQQNSIILVTDGIEECKGDPCAAAQELKDAGLDVHVNIVGFTLSAKEGEALQCVSDITGGKYYSASNAAGLTDALKQVQQQVQGTEVVQTAKKPDTSDILFVKNGGKLVMAPDDQWSTINTENFKGPTYAGEGIWSFRDGKPATFDRVEVLVTGANQYNLKDFEVLAGDDLNGTFNSAGEFTVLNSKVMPDGWQAFKFDPVTAKYIKIVFKSDQGGGYVNGHRIKVIGKVDETAAGAEKPSLGGSDILAAKSGGTIVMAPDDQWKTINTGNFKGPVYAGEGVWSFKDGKPATFDRIEVLVSGASQYNLKDFEVLAGDELGGTFNSVGAFTVQNTKVMPDGLQKFTFAPTTAKFVKIILKSDQGGGYVNGHEMRLFGKLDESAQAAAKPKAEGTDILAEKNGGKLVYAPNDAWSGINTTGEFKSATYAGNAVWSFKDGKPGIFDRIEVLVPDASQYNLKDFEVFSGNEGPNGAFTSLGAFTVQNTKVMPDGWQSFTLPSNTAKFVKVAFKTDQGGGYVRGHALRLMGKLDDSAPAAAKPPEETGADILAAKNGGTLLVSPNDEWAKLNNGKGDRAVVREGQGIWAFKGEKPATIDAVEVLVPESSQYNLKDFEVFVGDEGPTGKFNSVGTFTLQNVKMMPEGYQRFTFPPVTGKYIKFDFKTDQGGGYIAANQLRVLGKVQD